MAWTQSDIDALKAALAKGARSLRLNNEQVDFNSRAEMLKQLRLMEAEVSGVAEPQVTVSYPRTTRGL